MNNSYYEFLVNNRDKIESERIELFLNHILKIFKENYQYFCDNPRAKYDLVYSELAKYGVNFNTDIYVDNGNIKIVDIKSYNFFQRLENDFKYNKNIKVFCDEKNDFLQFTTGDLPDYIEFEKIYLSLDAKHIYKGTKDLFCFISSLGVSHLSKIARIIRSDNIVIRIKRSDKENLNKILEFIQNNQYIQEGMNPLNPFLPSENGVAHIYDNGGSYNSEVAKCIMNCVFASVNDNSISLDQFKNYVNSLEQPSNISILNKHLLNVKINEQAAITDNIFKTYLNIGYKQTIQALVIALREGNTEYLNNQCSAQKLLNQIYEVVETMGYDVFNISQEDIIKLYLSNLTRDYQKQILDLAVNVTSIKHGSDWTLQSIRWFINDDSVTGFSRTDLDGNGGYRDWVSKYVNRYDVYDIITQSLKEQDIDISNKSYESVLYDYTVTGLKDVNHYTY